MELRGDDRLAGALFRLISEQSGLDAAAILDLRTGVPRLVAATPALRAMRADGARPWPAIAVPAGVSGRDPAELGLAAGFLALAPVAGRGSDPAGCLIAAAADRRRRTAALARCLATAAELAAPLMRRPPAMPRLPGADRARTASRRLIEAALRGEAAGGAALMLLDLDRFRAVNEALGSAAGDTVLAVIGARLRRAAGTRHVLRRLGGDRFVLVAAAAAEAPAHLAERLLAAVRAPLVIAGRTLTLQASIGIVAATGAVPDAAELMVQADAALHRAKIEGRDRFVLHEPALAAAAFEGSRLELDLAGALRGGEMRLVYQPFVDLGTGRIAGFEALLRWQHPRRGELTPSSFIAAAESSGLILPLGDFVLRTALAAAAGWPAPLTLAVNISPLEFHQRGLVERIDAALAAAGFPAERLELEITETVLMRDSAETTARLRELVARGIRIALDDFGTGYSALAYLTRLPHHRLKLDKAFVHDLGRPSTAALIRAIIALARAEGVAVTAEGVERAAQIRAVRRAGFTHAQGFATGVPVADPAIPGGDFARVAMQ